MRCLLVEDDLTRVEWFRLHFAGEDIEHVTHPDAAIERLARSRYDELWLDHDLGTEPKAGRDVALWLAAHPACNPDLRITTHTVNVVSGPKIVRTLADAGRRSQWIPFTSMRDATSRTLGAV